MNQKGAEVDFDLERMEKALLIWCGRFCTLLFISVLSDWRSFWNVGEE